MPTVPAEALESLVARTLEAAGLSTDEARQCAAASIFADLHGTDTHGVMYIVPRTLGSIASGATVPGREMVVERDEGAVALVRGNGQVGPVFAGNAMRLAMAKAATFGVGVVCAYGGNPLGLLGYYPSLAAEKGLFGLAMANTSPSVAPFGSSTRVFGTNPFAYSAPAKEEHPVLFDIASSVAASGKLSQAKRRRELMPDDWVIDGSGEPITDPSRADEGALQPFGAHKGSGIALLVHLLTGALSGTTVGGESTHGNPDPSIRGQSAFFLAIDPGHFTSREDYQNIVDRQIRHVHAASPLPGRDSVLLPGERGWLEAEKRSERGVPIRDEDWVAILAAIERAGLTANDLARSAGVAI